MQTLPLCRLIGHTNPFMTSWHCLSRTLENMDKNNPMASRRCALGAGTSSTLMLALSFNYPPPEFHSPTLNAALRVLKMTTVGDSFAVGRVDEEFLWCPLWGRVWIIKSQRASEY